MVFRLAHGNSGDGIMNFLFSDGGRQVLCNRVEQVFPNKECTFSVASNGTGDEYASPIVFLLKIQLKSPKNWDGVDNEDIAYEVPWPVTGSAGHDGGKYTAFKSYARETANSSRILLQVSRLE